MKTTIVLAGGGTGGHVFPMIAVADALRAEADVRVVYVGTARGIESRVVPARGDELEMLDVLPIKGRGFIGALRGVLRAAGTLPQAISLLRKLGPKAVLTVGGYASGPIGLAAWLTRVPLGVLEPNQVAGLANRLLFPLASRVYVAFPDTGKKLRSRVVEWTGVPLRGSFAPTPYEPSAGAFRILVLGGSQGAQALNDAVPKAIAQIAMAMPELTVLHQAGRDRDEAVRRAYDERGLGGRATVVPFLDDVAGGLARADLVIERSGAGSLAELCAVGRASILIPFPFAADDHQRKNAEALAAAGAAVHVAQTDATPDRLASEIRALAGDAPRRIAMADAARAQGRPAAATTVARDLLSLGGVTEHVAARAHAGAAASRKEAAHV